MTDLSRGANTGITARALDVTVAGARPGSVDLMVFQLGADRRVRSDGDFVFFNQPASPEGAVRLIGPDRLSIDLAAVPAALQTLAVAVALDDAVPGSLAGITGLGVTLVGAAERHTAMATGMTTERAAVLIELYRRGPDWKVRNVSAGWGAGLPALAREHGVTVDEAPPVAQPALPHPAGPADRSMPGTPPTSALPHPGAAAAPAVVGGWPPPGGRPHPLSRPPEQLPATFGGWPLPGDSTPRREEQPPPAVSGGWPPPGR